MMQTEKKITVLIPTYQRPELLEKALESALNQTAAPARYDILVVDNDPAPNTETEHIARTCGARNLTYVKNPRNLGGYANWNRGFELAQTPWICLLHDDDLLLPTCVEQCYRFLARYENARLGAVIPKQCNLYDDPAEKRSEEWEKRRNWKARADHFLRSKTEDRLWKVGLFDNYMICSAYPSLSGGGLLRRSAVLEMGGFGTLWPCEDIFLLNRLARRYDCYLIGRQWGWYRFGSNNIWSKPAELVRWDQAKKLFREAAAQHDLRCALYHKAFGPAMCWFDCDETVRFAKRRGNTVDTAAYTWLKDSTCPVPVRRICRANLNLWRMWMSLRVWLLGKRLRA